MLGAMRQSGSGCTGLQADELILSERTDTAIVDETAVNVAGRQVWLWLAIEPEHRAVLALMLTETRNVLVAHSLFTSLRHRGVRHIITDNAPWYRLAAGQGLWHSVVYSLRSYVERFIETIKDMLMRRLLFPIAQKAARFRSMPHICLGRLLQLRQVPPKLWKGLLGHYKVLTSWKGA